MERGLSAACSGTPYPDTTARDTPMHTDHPVTAQPDFYVHPARVCGAQASTASGAMRQPYAAFAASLAFFSSLIVFMYCAPSTPATPWHRCDVCHAAVQVERASKL
jgi:hypothetical protein